MNANGTQLDERLLAVEQLYERLQALYDSHTLQLVRLDTQVAAYHTSYSRAMLMLEYDSSQGRKDALRAVDELRAVVALLGADSVMHRTNDARLAEQVTSLHRQQLYQSIIGGVAMVVALTFLVVILIVVRS